MKSLLSKEIPVLAESSQGNLRAGERVRQYLLSEFEVSNLADGTRLPSNKEIAKRLKVSSVTVNSTLQELAREGRIRARRGSGTYLVAPEVQDPATLKIVVGVPMQDMHGLDEWVDGILGSMLRSAFRSKPTVTFQGVSQEVWGKDTVVDELLSLRKEVNGLILFPFTLAPHQYPLVDSFEAANKPVIHIHPPEPLATANYVSADYFQSSQKLGEAWAAVGRRRVLVIRNTPERKNIAAQMRQAGLLSGLGTGVGNAISVNVLEMQPDSSVDAVSEAVTDFLSNSLAPDAIFCVTDLMGVGAIRAIRAAGLDVPNDVSVVGGIGMDIVRGFPLRLSHITQPLSQMGESALDLMLRRLAAQGDALPAIIREASFLPGDTTTEAENELLRSAFSTKPRTAPTLHASTTQGQKSL